MKLGILVGHIKSEVEEQKQLAIAPQINQAEDFYFSNLEAQKTFLELDAVIKQLEAFDQDQPATSDHVKLITDFLERRWERIQNTDLIYPISTEHHVTKLCLYIAKYLADQRDLVMKRNHYALLMPTIKSWHNESSHTDISTLYLHNFLPDDTNTFCFQLGYIDLSLNKATNGLDMSVLIQGDPPKRYYLSPREFNLVYKHSHVISDFIDMMKLAYENQEAAAKKLTDINLAKINMLKALRDKEYGKRTVQSSYGQDGRVTLQNNLLKDVNNLFINREQVFQYMSLRVKPEQWGEFLLKMDDGDKFKHLMLCGDSFDEVIASKTLFTQNGKYNRAVAYCMVETYSRLRLAEGEYTSAWGYASSFFARVFPKDIKEKVVQIMRKYLTGTAGAALDCTKFFFVGDMDAARRANFNDEEIDLLNAMKNSRVGKIHECICGLLLPADVKVNDNQPILVTGLVK